MSGIIPAEGTVQVHVLFRPTRLYTSMQKVPPPLMPQHNVHLLLTLPPPKDFRQPFPVRIQPFHCMCMPQTPHIKNV
jgi:hypothetical protein